MVSYYCYVGDQDVGWAFIKVIFGNLKLNRVMESFHIGQNKNGKEVKLLLRFYLDGTVSEYTQINSDSHFFTGRDNAFIYNYRLNHDNEIVNDLGASFNFIKEKTILAITQIKANDNSKIIFTASTTDLVNSIKSIFNDFYISNVLNP